MNVLLQQNLSSAWCWVFCVYECPLLAQSGHSFSQYCFVNYTSIVDGGMLDLERYPPKEVGRTFDSYPGRHKNELVV